MKHLPTLGGMVWLCALSLPVHAMPTPSSVTLDSSIQCTVGNAQNGIQVSDVIGDDGGATDCWGTLNDNDPGPDGKFVIDSMEYLFHSKIDTPGGNSGANIGLQAGPGGVTSGTWSFDGNLFDPDEFLIVLKAASSPGYGVWLFSGPDAASTSGTWNIAWNQGLSHLAVYSKMGGPTPPNSVPEAATLGLMGFGLLGLGVTGSRRHRSR